MPQAIEKEVKVNKLRISISGLAVILFLACDIAQAGVDEIKVLYQKTNERIKKNIEKPLSLYANDKRGNIEWRRVLSRADSDAFDKSDFRTHVYLHNGKVVKAEIETTSESGDWKLTEEYYFYTNEHVAFYFQSLVTYQAFDYEHDQELPEGPYVLEKRFYYNEGGKNIRSLEKAFVQQTQKDIPVKYVRAELPIKLYQDVKSLPFYKAINND